MSIDKKELVRVAPSGRTWNEVFVRERQQQQQEELEQKQRSRGLGR